MKSIRDWRDEKYQAAVGIDPKAIRAIVEDKSDLGGFDSSSMRRVMGGPSTRIDQEMQSDLRGKLMQIIRDNPGNSPVETLRQIIAIAGKLLADVSGNTLSVSKLSKLGGDLDIGDE